MTNIDFFSKYVPNFIFILLRASIFMSMLPFFGSKSFPAQLKIGFAIALALVLSPVTEFRIKEDEIPLLVIKEIIFAMTLGLAVRFVFMAVDMAGQAISNAMGLSIAMVFNPEVGQTTEISRLQGIIAMLIFLAMDAHHDLIYIFVRSYEFLPAGQVNIKNLATEFIALGNRIFLIAIKMGAPVIVGMLIASFLLGFIYKAAPQINIFFVSFPVYLFLGFLLMLLSIPVFVYVLEGSFSDVKNEMYRIIAIAKG